MGCILGGFGWLFGRLCRLQHDQMIAISIFDQKKEEVFNTALGGALLLIEH
jgi:hypothetical protein